MLKEASVSFFVLIFVERKLENMDDYKGIFAQEFFGTPKTSRRKRTFSVDVVDRETKEVFWSGLVEATSGKNAQAQWRKEYSDIRKQYDHSCGLSIKEATI